MIRIIFGVFVIGLMGKIFDKKVREIINTDSTKLALIAGIGFILYLVYYMIVIGMSFEGFYGLSISLIISQIFLQQITTGFYEELLFRGLVLEGYFTNDRKTIALRIIYGFISFVFFGAVHVITNFNLEIFLKIGVIGFAFAAVYLVSHNLLIPILLHFIYDVIANLTSYIMFRDSEMLVFLNTVGFDVMFIVMFIVSLVVLLKVSDKQQCN